MSLTSWYKAAFMYRTRQNIAISFLITISLAVSYCFGRFHQYKKDQIKLEIAAVEKMELVNQIKKDINFLLDSHIIRKEKTNADKQSETDKLPVSPDEPDRVQEKD